MPGRTSTGIQEENTDVISVNMLYKNSEKLRTVPKLCDSEAVRRLDVEGRMLRFNNVREELNPSRVRTGFKKPSLVEGKDYIVCSEGFPSAALGISWLEKGRKLYLYCEAVDEQIEGVLPVELVRVDRVQATAKLEDKNTITVITGSLPYVDNLVNSSSSFPFVNTLLAIPYSRFRKGELRRAGLQWTKIAHAALGGVTTSAWSIGIPKRSNSMKLMDLSPSADLKRCLRHIIKDGELEKIVDAPSSNSLSELITKESMSDKIFYLPCYKSCTGWVARKLSSFEKGMAFDFNDLVLKNLMQLEELESRLDSLIVLSIPGKVTQLLHHAVVALWGTTRLTQELASRRAGNGNLVLINPEPVVVDFENEQDKRFLEREASYLLDYGQKAVKSDDADVPIELWDRCVLRSKFIWLNYTPQVAESLRIIRERFAMPIYLKNLRRSFLRYLNDVYGKCWWNKLVGDDLVEAKRLRLELSIGVDSLVRCSNSTWWEWRDGSTCHFWRWPKEVRTFIRDGFPVFVEQKLPEYKMKQRFQGLNAEQLQALEHKIHKVIDRRYLNEGYVKSLINYFAVPKGLSDIRVVYDGTKSGLTDSVWAPNFFMPSIDSLLLYCSANTWYSDLDLGEMFLNYFMDPKLRPFCGVDVSNFVAGSGKSTRKWLQWNRIFMGFRSSPYYAVKSYNWCLDVVRGNPDDAGNPFAFNKVKLNLPGSEGYDPIHPWLVKMFGKSTANEIIVYMDDGRPHGDSEAGCRKAGKRTSKITQHLGQQDAARKYRPPSQQPGPWCGAFIAERSGSLWAYVSNEKWSKAKNYISSWLKEIEMCKAHSAPPALNFKHLERGRGFLVYLSRTYPSIVPYLKGIHLTLDTWRPGRGKDGWKRTKASIKDEMAAIEFDDDYTEEEVLPFLDSEGNIKADANLYTNHPDKVGLAPRMYDDLEALALFFKSDNPSWRFIRGSEICVVEYGFGDASGVGFGSSFESKGGISYRLGVWGKDVGGESSNFRELSNLVDALYDRCSNENGTPTKGSEVFLFTDNAVAEGAFYKGTSSSKKLFNLVLKLRLLEMKAGMKIHIIHIAGTRMIAQGTDGLSRGDSNEGVMQGKSMLDFVPLAKTCLRRSSKLKDQLKWCLTFYLKEVNKKLIFLNEKDWFLRGHDICGGKCNADGIWMPAYQSAVYVWTPAPAAGQHAVEQLRQARLKRTSSTHLFLVPRIFTSIWRKQLHKVADLVVELPFDDECWQQNIEHEPLTLAFVFPFVCFKPWQLKRTYAILGMGRVLRRLWKESNLSTWHILHKFLLWAGRLYTMPEGVVRKMLQSASSFEILCRKAGE